MEINLCKWMKGLDGSRPVFEYNIVGTHDSVTQYVQFSYITKCQNMSIYEQLCIGIRMLDIRVKNEGERLKWYTPLPRFQYAKSFRKTDGYG